MIDKMTKEEALKKVKGYLTDYLPLEDADEIDEIIEALEQTSEDCISRDDVFETYKVLYDVFDDNPNICNELHKVYVKLNKLPSVTPQQKMGRWILIHKNVNMYVCSECNNEPLLIGESYPIFKLSDYCPHCGAKMEMEVE